MIATCMTGITPREFMPRPWCNRSCIIRLPTVSSALWIWRPLRPCFLASMRRPCPLRGPRSLANTRSDDHGSYDKGHGVAGTMGAKFTVRRSDDLSNGYKVEK